MHQLDLNDDNITDIIVEAERRVLELESAIYDAKSKFKRR